MRYAIVDTGSNTIRMSIYEYENNNLNELFTEAVFANLAGYIIDNRLTDEGIVACCDAIMQHKKTAQKYNAEFYVFATAAIRNAENTEEIIKKVKENTGITLKILSGEDEGELSFLGAYEDFLTSDGIMADVGGGSSEIIAFSQGKIQAIQSVPLGSLAAYKKFVFDEIPTLQEVKDIKNAIKSHLEKNEFFKSLKKENFCLVGGGVRAAKKLSSILTGQEDLNVDIVNTILSQLLARNDAMDILEKTVPKRKFTIIPGLAIYSEIGEYFGADKIKISDKGIKEGYVLKYLIH